RLRPFHAPSVSISGFQENVKPSFPQSYQLIVEQDGRQHKFEFVPQPERVAILLFHRKQRRFMVLRRFRSEVFVSRVMTLPGNEGKKVHEIDWSLYDRERGCTTELCIGEVEERKEHIDDTALAVLEEEWGYRVDKKYLKHVKTFVTGVTKSGAPCHIYYAELDKAEKIREGRVEKRQEVQRVWLGMATAQVEVKRKESDPLLVSSLNLFAFHWWFHTMHHSAMLPTMEKSLLFGVDIRSAVSARREFESEMEKGPMEGRMRWQQPSTIETAPSRYPKMMMKYLIMGLDKSCDMTMRPDTVAILIKDDEKKEWIMTRRFRPAVCIGRVRTLPENEGKSLEEIDFSAYPGVWAYTQELASGEILEGETARNAVLRVAAANLGYRIRKEELKFVARLVDGSSGRGESKHLFYAECREEDRIENWKEVEGIERISFPRWKYALHLSSLSSPPSVFVVQQWLMWSEKRPTEEEDEVVKERREKRKEERRKIKQKWKEEDDAEWKKNYDEEKRLEKEKLEKERVEREKKEEEEKRKAEGEERNGETEVKEGENEVRKRRNDTSDEEIGMKRRRKDTVEGGDEVRDEEIEEDRPQSGNDAME
ncbi:hypothetical protein PENTCL1PPCAC_16621, partial [Pristionchus entomophagus]